MTLVSRLRPLLRLLSGRRHLLAGAVVVGVANQLLTIAIAVIGACLVGRAVTGAAADELLPLLWTMVALIVPPSVHPVAGVPALAAGSYMGSKARSSANDDVCRSSSGISGNRASTTHVQCQCASGLRLRPTYRTWRNQAL